jgi:hypothetical protein
MRRLAPVRTVQLTASVSWSVVESGTSTPGAPNHHHPFLPSMQHQDGVVGVVSLPSHASDVHLLPHFPPAGWLCGAAGVAKDKSNTKDLSPLEYDLFIEVVGPSIPLARFNNCIGVVDQPRHTSRLVHTASFQLRRNLVTLRKLSYMSGRRMIPQFDSPPSTLH